MQKRSLGRGMQVSAMGFGCMGLTGMYGTPPDRQKGIEIIRAIELTPGDLREIDAAASKIEVKGARLPDAVLQYSNR